MKTMHVEKRIRRPGALAAALSMVMFGFFLSAPAFGQEDLVKYVEEKRLELKAREEALKKEEERLKVLRKDVDEKIDRYSKLLEQLEASLKKAEQLNEERLVNVAKVYEAMTPEEAAAKIKAMDVDTAVQILLKMKSKKAGPIIALLDPKKAVIITTKMASLKNLK